ncbi:conserved hypothetical protein [Ricinus communis]|uniref:Uncharacterized protein n=1 Tax=Ricinus communis TaxID=3988 RepID=B9T361_RICCO|nr:conserved hypothetical protein [Ricinus communis]
MMNKQQKAMLSELKNFLLTMNLENPMSTSSSPGGTANHDSSSNPSHPFVDLSQSNLSNQNSSYQPATGFPIPILAVYICLSL